MNELAYSHICDEIGDVCHNQSNNRKPCPISAFTVGYALHVFPKCPLYFLLQSPLSNRRLKDVAGDSVKVRPGGAVFLSPGLGASLSCTF